MIDVILGNLRVGDALWCLRECVEAPEPTRVICTPYNAPAVETVARLTRLRIDEVDIRGPAPPINSEGDYIRWIDENYHPEPGHTPVRFLWDKQFGDNRPFPLREERQPSAAITAQLTSLLPPNRDWHPITDALESFREQVLTIWAGEGPVVGTKIVGDLPSIGEILLRSSLHVGMASSVSLLAMLLGVPTVFVWVAGPDSRWPPSPPHVRPLHLPSVPAIHEAMHALRPL